MTARFPANAELARPTLNRTRRSTIGISNADGTLDCLYTYAPQVLHAFGNALGSMMPHISERIGERIGADTGRVRSCFALTF
jgi:hypothetical protein